MTLRNADDLIHYTDKNDIGTGTTVGDELRVVSSYTPSGTGAESRTIVSKLGDLEPHLFDFVPAGQHAAILNETTTYDATTDLADLIVAADGGKATLPPGKIKVTGASSRLTSTTALFKAGFILRGAGMMKTKIVYDSASTDLGILTLSTGDTSGLKYMLGMEISDLTIEQVGSAANIDAIRLSATWFGTIQRVRFLSMTRHGIYVPPRTDIAINSDSYQNLYTRIEHCDFDSCGGWGIRYEAGNGAGPHFIIGNRITNCAGGGLYTEVGQGEIKNNVIGTCGTYTASDSGGMIVDSAAVADSGPTPFGLDIVHNEFDTNENVHCHIKAGSRISGRLNRAISNVSGGVMRPAIHFSFGKNSESKAATYCRFVDNAHRSTNPSALAVYWYDQEVGSSGNIVDNALNIDSGAGLVKYNNYTAGNVNIVVENNVQIVP